jgi:hypothetical protein
MIVNYVTKANGTREFTVDRTTFEVKGVAELNMEASDDHVEITATAHPQHQLDAVASMQKFAEALGIGYSLEVEMKVVWHDLWDN